MESENTSKENFVASVGLTEISSEPRARDLDLAERLGFDRPRDIRKLIERNIHELKGLGDVRATVARSSISMPIGIVVAIGTAVFFAAWGPAHAHGRPPQTERAALPARFGVAGRDVLAEASRWIGSGKFTGLPGPWCADAVSAWLRRTGHRPLAGRMASDALRYGPRLNGPRVGALAVLRGHVGLVEAVEPDGSILLISGNWGRKVARAVIPRWEFVAFVSVG